MQYTAKELQPSTVEYSIIIDSSDIEPALTRAAQQLSALKPLPGFRPGKATFETVKTHFGEMALYEQALPELIRNAFAEIVEKEKIEVYGQPQVSVKKLAPGNPIELTAEVIKIPHTLSLPELSSLSITAKDVSVDEKQVADTLKELSKMQVRSEKVDRAAEATDKVVVDMDLSLDGVAVEGGQARNHSILLGEEYYIPGVKEQLLGLKAGESKKFTLPFPETHYQKHLAGKNVEFAVTLKEVHSMTLPEIDDAFAKSLGQEDLATLSTLLRKNLEEESTKRESDRQEIELLKAIVAKATFEQVPDVIVNTEVDRMMHELQHDVEARGLEYSQYLESVKKTVDEVKLEFAPQAVERIQVAMVINALALQFGVKITDEEVLEEVQKILNQYQDPQSQERIRSEGYQDYLRTTLRNRKVISLLKEKVKRVAEKS